MPRPRKVAETVQPRDEEPQEDMLLIPSGSSMLNLALSDNVFGGIRPGTIINIAGEFGVGKTMIAETMAAEIAHNPAFDGYELIYDEPERAMAMDIARLFGQKTFDRLQPPRVGKDGLATYSETVEQFYVNVLERIDNGSPFIYLLDSLDALTDQTEIDLGDDLKKSAEKAEKSGHDLSNLSIKGNYSGVSKAKLMSQLLRGVVSGIYKTKSVLVIISQVRDNLNKSFGGPSKVKSGGKALDFYSSVVVFLHHKKTLTKELKSEDKEQIGALVRAEVTKNKFTGKKRSVEFSIFYDYGIDDLTSCVDFLVSAGVIQRKGAHYHTGELLDGSESSFQGLEKLIRAIEAGGSPAIRKIKEAAQKAWTEREEELKLHRRPRFGSE